MLYRWQAIGLTPSGLIIIHSGMYADDDPHAAAQEVDRALRHVHPTVRWCHPDGSPEAPGDRYMPVMQSTDLLP